MEKSWYLLYVRERKELKVATLLDAQQIENYCPLSEKAAGGIFRTKVYREPLLPGMLLVRISETDIQKIRNTRYVVNFVHWKNKPKRVTENYVMTLQSFCKNYCNITVKKCPINDGSYRGVKRVTYDNKIEIILPEIGLRFLGDSTTSDNNSTTVLVRRIEQKSVATLTR